jgi:TolB-like protein/Flp pilus assembly protein TadD
VTLFEQLKRRKIVQWALAYLAGAWVTLQLVAILAGQFGWPEFAQRGITIVLLTGFFITLVVAWYHGEQGRQRVSGPELLMVAALLVLAGAATVLVRGETGGGQDPPREGVERGATGPAGTKPGDAGAAAATEASDLLPVSERSIAVLPLDNLSPAGEHDYFAGAMTEEITTALSKVPDLRVTSRNSAAKFAAASMSVREFAHELGVAHVLEGSVQRIGDQVRITVQLIEARTDEHLWSATYERELVDVLRVQVEIAEQIADRLAASFSDRERERILAGASEDPVAYDLYLRARQVDVDLAGPEEIDASIEQLRRATERNPDFSLAWAELSFRYSVKASYAGREWIDSSGPALDRAVETADDSSLAVVLRAYQSVLGRGDREEGLAWLREAVADHGSNYPLVMSLARLQRFTGDLPEVVRWLHRAAALDPLSPVPWMLLAEAYGQVGLHGRAERAVRRALEMEPGDPWAWLQLGDVQMAAGEYEDAMTTADSLAERSGEVARAMRAWIHLRRGDLDRAHALMEQVADSRIAEGPMGRYLMPLVAHLRFQSGDSVGGRRAIERARARLGTGADVVPAGDELLALKVAALGGDAPASVEALRAYVRAGGRGYHEIERSPLFARVRRDPAFRDELARLEHTVEQMRRQIERDLAARR